MAQKIYVGNISFNVGESEIADLCAEYGTVTSAKLITDRDTGRSKGFAFVEMSSEEEAQACIENLNGRDVGGRNLKVNIAEDRPQRRSGGGGGYGGGGRNDRGGRGGYGDRNGGGRNRW